MNEVKSNFVNLKTRFLAFLLDWSILLILLDTIFRKNYSVNLTLELSESNSYDTYLELKILIIFLYFAIFWLSFSATPAKLLLGIKIVNFSGKKPSLKQVSLRLLLYFLSIIFFPSFYYLLKDKSRMTFYDKISETQLIIKND